MGIYLVQNGPRRGDILFLRGISFGEVAWFLSPIRFLISSFHFDAQPSKSKYFYNLFQPSTVRRCLCRSVFTNIFLCVDVDNKYRLITQNSEIAFPSASAFFLRLRIDIYGPGCEHGFIYLLWYETGRCPLCTLNFWRGNFPRILDASIFQSDQDSNRYPGSWGAVDHGGDMGAAKCVHALFQLHPEFLKC